MTDDLPLFDLPPAQARRAPAARPQLAHHAPKWTRYKAKVPHKCDDCLKFLAEHDGHGPLSADAHFRRKTPDVDLLLCHQHAQIWRGHDKLPKFAETKGRRG